MPEYHVRWPVPPPGTVPHSLESVKLGPECVASTGLKYLGPSNFPASASGLAGLAESGRCLALGPALGLFCCGGAGYQGPNSGPCACQAGTYPALFLIS